MRMYDLLEKKKLGQALSEEEISYMISEYTKGEIPDYQMSAMTMAICLKGMTPTETTALTLAMAHSGDMIHLSEIKGVKVDKHSSGGVGDKTSIALIPWVASCGAKIAKMSGRGLGFTGGTLDKLESFPGFQITLSQEELIHQVNTIGCAIGAQTGNLTPADKKLYALRDATDTVDSMSLIASSIMSKKLASGADAIVLDVKYGSGAFMHDPEDAKALAKMMLQIGKDAGHKMCAVITSMEQPLGLAVGNAVEVREAIDTLKGKGPEDFLTLCYTLGAEMLRLAGICENRDSAKALMQEHLENGDALKQLERWISAQKGDTSYISEKDFPKASTQVEILSPMTGIVSRIQCDEIGNISMLLGGGRERKEDEIDLSAGIILKAKTGDHVIKGEPLAILHTNQKERVEEATNRFLKAVSITDASVAVTNPPLIYEILE